MAPIGLMGRLVAGVATNVLDPMSFYIIFLYLIRTDVRAHVICASRLAYASLTKVGCLVGNLEVLMLRARRLQSPSLSRHASHVCFDTWNDRGAPSGFFGC